MNTAGVTPKSIAQKWQFGVEIDGFNAAYFTKIGLPEVEFEEVTFAPAGSMFNQKAAGRASFSDIDAEKGVPQDVSDFSLLNWVKKCIDVFTATGGVPADYMKDIDIVRYDRTGKEIQRYRLYGAWVKRAKFGELEGGSSDNDIESMTISYQYFNRIR